MQQFKRQAAKIKDAIIEITNRHAKHPAIWKIQDIFREKADRLYHWADDRTVPADNNLAERELRPLVIARKISFGSQSENGAKTRETLMTFLHTLRKRTPDVTTAFKSALDKIATCFGEAGLKTAQQVLTPYSDIRSRHDFTQAQIFAVLALRQFFKHIVGFILFLCG